jgi:hypothetical protein
MTIDEDTGENVVCPICDAQEYWECGHLVAKFDRTFCECQGGVFYGQMGKFSSLIEGVFLRFLKADDEPVFKSGILEELWDAARLSYVPEEGYVGLDSDILLTFLIELLEDEGAFSPSGSLMDPGGPGMTSSISILFDDKPTDVIESAFKAVSKELEGQGTTEH